MSGILKDEKGSALILMTIALAAMLTMAALVVDVGIAYCHGSRLQNAADAAVFAGGRLCPRRNGTRIGCAPSRTGPGVFGKNGVAPEEIVSIDFTDFIDGSYYGLQVFLNTQSETGFARVLGVDSIAVDKQAGVKVRPEPVR